MKRIPFRFVARQGGAGIVEVERGGATERVLLPMDIIMEAKTDLTDAQINTGIPYGLPFADFLTPEIETALHNYGVWTLADLYQKSQSAVDALNSIGTMKLGDVIRAAEKYQQQDHGLKATTLAAHKKSKKEKHNGRTSV